MFVVLLDFCEFDAYIGHQFGKDNHNYYERKEIEMNIKRSTLSLLLMILAIFQLEGKPIVDELEGQYIDGTSTSITLVIKRVSVNEILITDPNGTFIKEAIRVGILEKKVVDLVGMKSSSYITTNKDVRFSEMNGEITLSLFTDNQAFIGKKKHSQHKTLLGKTN